MDEITLMSDLKSREDSNKNQDVYYKGISWLSMATYSLSMAEAMSIRRR